mgnify:FL=1
MKYPLLCMVLSFAIVATPAFADDGCRGWRNTSTGTTYSGIWEIKKNAYCELQWRIGSDSMSTQPIEVVGMPKSCKYISNKNSIAATCSQSGKFHYSITMHGIKNGQKYKKTYHDTLIVFE